LKRAFQGSYQPGAADPTSELKNAKHVAQWKSTLETYAFPHLKSIGRASPAGRHRGPRPGLILTAARVRPVRLAEPSEMSWSSLGGIASPGSIADRQRRYAKDQKRNARRRRKRLEDKEKSR
jgi:hypothetical protein